MDIRNPAPLARRQQGSTFECQPDKKAFKPCSSPNKVKNLEFKVVDRGMRRLTRPGRKAKLMTSRWTRIRGSQARTAPSSCRVRLGVLVVAFATAMTTGLIGGTAWASHIAGATYTGTLASGSPMSLTVSPDGTGITTFSLAGPIPGSSCTFSGISETYSPPLPLRDATIAGMPGHMFDKLNGAPPLLTVVGSFTRLQAAEGFIQLQDMTSGAFGCSANFDWSATTTAQPPDDTPPETIITKGAPEKTHKTSVKFEFYSSEESSTFACKLDKGAFKPCTSPKKVKKLDQGKHTFQAQATDFAGNVDPTPSKYRFKVLG